LNRDDGFDAVDAGFLKTARYMEPFAMRRPAAGQGSPEALELMRVHLRAGEELAGQLRQELAARGGNQGRPSGAAGGLAVVGQLREQVGSLQNVVLTLCNERDREQGRAAVRKGEGCGRDTRSCGGQRSGRVVT
jgi:hypothetical protein